MAVSLDPNKTRGRLAPSAEPAPGNRAIDSLADTATCTAQLELTQDRREIEFVTRSAADRVVRHDSEMRTLEPAADAIAQTANRARRSSA